MSHKWYLGFFYYYAIMGIVGTTLLICVQVRTYRRTQIRSLLELLAGNIAGLLYFAIAMTRQLMYPSPEAAWNLLVVGAIVWTLGAIIGTWGCIRFLFAVEKLASNARNG